MRKLNFVEPQDFFKALTKVNSVTVTTDYNMFNITDTPFASVNVISRIKDVLTVKRIKSSLYQVSRKG